ncbi:MAG TPA: enolase C-terminal domain-like protein [Blastocatellia bacterium]|nr:enolase C-terminal domain-like protein [Blastocatellia bacterium]HMZ19973.1 enolase C-terminal domain-like protein [Blastocatellia bacterium]
MVPSRQQMFFAAPSLKSSDIRIEDVSFSYEEFLYRAPYKFGGVPVDRATILNVNVVVKSRSGKMAKGFGSMPLGNVWSFPSREMNYNATLGAMKSLAERIARITSGYKEFGHPIDLNFALEPEYLKAATEASKELKLVAPIPKLCTLVTASAFDAAIHDAFGKLHGRSSYQTNGRDLMTHDLSRYLNNDFIGEFPDRYILPKPKPGIAMFHSVGGADAVLPSELKQRLNDGMPETLAEWIEFNGLTHIKIKLQGEDLKWDIERTVNIDRVASEARPTTNWKYCVDFNERCPNVEYVLEYLRKVKELTPKGFNRILYLEQPTARDLQSNRQNVMHQANKLRPVLIDESLVDLETLLLAREMGYTGVALKACKGQSQAILMAAAAQKYKMFLSVQDLTCPGAALIHSVGIAAHVPGVAGVEANARQYMPAANKPWEKRFPGLFIVKDGTFRTSDLNRKGLAAVD